MSNKVQIQSPNWSDCIWELEKKAGLSQRQIAKKVGASPATVNRMKNQDGYRPNWETGAAVLLCLGEIEE